MKREYEVELNIANNSKVINGRGVSPVISTIIITASLLIILITAFFFATNMLGIQIQSSEFEQAKTAMRLLDKTIMDVSLRPGAVSSVQFNQGSGGIGVYGGDQINIVILRDSEVIWNKTITSYVIKYRGGSLTPATQMDLTNPGGLILRDPSKPLGYVRVEIGDGAWIVLDYNRVLVVENESLKIIEARMICLTQGRFGGSGTVTVRVQNMGAHFLFSGNLNGNITLQVQVGDKPPATEAFSLGENMYNVRVIATFIEVSIIL
ncbi:MAG: hypothetical protein QXT26_02900 [Thermoproteota archaeon]